MMEVPTWLPKGFCLDRRIQTHVSEVFIGSEYVLKRERSVALPFVDHTSLRARVHSTFEELRLNRRLAPDVYLGVQFLLRIGETLELGELLQEEVEPSPEVIDALVLMRRLDEDNSLARLLERAQSQCGKLLEKTTLKIAEFHKGLAGESVDYQPVFQQAAEDNFSYLTEAVSTQGFSSNILCEPFVTELMDLQARRLAQTKELIESREAQGLVRDGHGDLRLEHVFITPEISQHNTEVTIIDCIEFSAELRIADVLNDIAFLAMELEYFDRRDLALTVYAEYARAFPQATNESLFYLYKAYKALVRAKVELIQAVENERSIAAAERFLLIASRNLYHCPDTFLVVVSGPIGVGKSTVAKEIAKRLGAEYLSSDEVRIAIAGADAQSRTEEYAGGRYAIENRTRVYEMLCSQARQALEKRTPVIIDATFSRSEFRRPLQQLLQEQLFQESGTRFAEVSCRADEEVIRQRLRARSAAGAGASDGREEILSAHLREYQWPSAAHQLDMNTSVSSERIAELVQGLVAAN